MIDLATLRGLSQGQVGVVDAACPECGPGRRSPANRARPTLRIWDDGEFLTYTCARCGISGWAADERRGQRLIAPMPAKVQAPDKAEIAQALWARAMPLAGSLAETYLRSRACFLMTSAIRFLPARGKHSPAMIARFGSDHPLPGVHLTRLAPDGSGKAGTDKDKIMIGRSAGCPIVIRDNPDRGELVIAEGIEDTASLALATGWTAWAAGSASRIPSIVAGAAHFDRVYVAVDDDPAGKRALANARSVRPDIIAISVGRMIGPGLDANAAIQKYGKEAIVAAVECGDGCDRYARGEIGFQQMQSECANAQMVLDRIAAGQG